MELLSLISGDNIFKYSFTLGLVMVIFSLIYPLQKKYQIDLEIIQHNKETELINKEISELKTKITENKRESDELAKLTDVYHKLNPDEKAILRKRKIKFDSEYHLNIQNRKSIGDKLVIQNYEKQKIKALISQSKTFDCYTNWLLFIGIILSSLGFVGWIYITIKELIKEHKK